MARARKGRTSIRTVGATTQEQFLERVRLLRDDPTLVIPECTVAVPAIERLERRLSRMAGGKPGLLARFDKGIVGAVARSIALAQRESATHLLDARVDGQRRFYLTVGHVPRPLALGVQNHDDPATLILAYGGIAQRHHLWFFAGSALWCTGSLPQPPDEWFGDLAQRAGFPLVHHGGLWSCTHATADRLVLRFQDGPAVAACGTCVATSPLHALIEERVQAPDRSQLYRVEVQRSDGGVLGVDERVTAAMRKGRLGETAVLAQALEEWRRSSGSQGARWLLGSRDFGADQKAFLDALAPRSWERAAVAAATAGGHTGVGATVNDILAQHADRIEEAVATLLGDRSAAFVGAKAGLAPVEIVRQAHEEAQRQRTLAALPPVRPRGPLGAWVDDWARFHLTHGRAECVERLRREARKPPVGRPHLYALGSALGGDLSVENLFDADQKAAGRSLEPLMRPVLEARGPDYARALRAYLEGSGSGEALDE